jgi:uncharacterized membrane protein
MSYQERRAIVSLISTILVTTLYWAYIAPKYPNSDAYSPDVFHFWGSAFVILIPVGIAAKIVIAIVFVILNAIATREVEPIITDERDRLVELKATRNSLYVFVLGFMIAMGSLVFSLPPSVMFIILICSGVVSEMIGDISQFLYYRRGV